jgi:hypothetical protein
MGDRSASCSLLIKYEFYLLPRQSPLSEINVAAPAGTEIGLPRLQVPVTQIEAWCGDRCRTDAGGWMSVCGRALCCLTCVNSAASARPYDEFELRGRGRWGRFDWPRRRVPLAGFRDIEEIFGVPMLRFTPP